MELKKYQKRVIADLTDYLAKLSEHSSLSGAFTAFWESRQIPVGRDGIPGYRNIIDGVPHVCYKVPTGGGKTLLACASVKPIFDALPTARRRVVVWLVPSDPILVQTLAALKDPHHPYRQRLNRDFGGRVEVYSKEELLAGQNFSPATVADQLSVMVLSYDSFRTSRKEGRRAYRANGSLASFATALGAPDQPIANADQTALFQVINQLNPVVIVDESHNATSELSTEMLVNFNPAFILDLTATPKKQSNIISHVDALALKNENMVKLPVIVYNRSSQAEVVTDAIDLRQSLEVAAAQQQARGGRYIRPIVLFQAQPRASEDATSFEKLRDKLVKTGIPAEQIAIKTGDINELKGVDLLSPDCEIRYIITVDALKEGWDCPFAYVLASLANKTSQVDVEQILGRVLRQPHATRQRNQLLNMSYVLTSSNDFSATLQQIVTGLNRAGFSKRDFRAAYDSSLDLTPEPTTPTPQLQLGEPQDQSETAGEDFLDFDEHDVASNLERRRTTARDSAESADTDSGLASMLEHAAQQGADYNQQAEQVAHLGDDFVPSDLEETVDTTPMIADFQEEVSELRIPQFVIQTPPSVLFPSGGDGVDLLRHDALAADFVLRDKDIQLDLTIADEQMYKIDVNKQADVPRAFRMSASDQRIMREHFSKLSVEAQKYNAGEAIYERLKPINSVDDSDLRSYIKRIADDFDSEKLLAYQERPNAVADTILKKIKGLLEDHKVDKFYEYIETGRISIRHTYHLPLVIQPIHSSSLIGGSLYEAEDQMNKEEADFAGRFSGMTNVRWWHRNIARKGFAINGPFNHYPDFIVMTTSGIVVLVEPKGEQLKNDDSQRKIRLGTKWASLAGSQFRYYMVFQDGITPPDGALNKSQFFAILKQL